MPGCNFEKPIEMPVCQHLTPAKFYCRECHISGSIPYKEQITTYDIKISSSNETGKAYPSYKTVKSEIEDRVELLETVFNELAKEVTLMKETFSQIHVLTEAASKAQMIFAQKVHDLKYIDKKRDDVINNLCQKIELLYEAVYLDKGERHGTTSR